MEDKKSGQEMAKNSKRHSVGKNHVDYWKKRLFRKTYTYQGKRTEIEEWSVRLQHLARREAFALGSNNQAVASVKAKEIATFLEANGWEPTLEKYKPKIEGKDYATFGEFEAELKERSGLKSKTLHCYLRKLRPLLAAIGKVNSDKSRFDYRTGGHANWKAKINRLSLGLLTTESVQAWRSEYISTAGENAAKRRSAERSAASCIRCSRSLWKPEVVSRLRIKIPPSPFKDIKLNDPGAVRYVSTVDVATLLKKAAKQLRSEQPQEYLALLITLGGGLRRREADLLQWEQVDFENNQIHIRRTVVFEPKTEESIRDIDMAKEIMALLRATLKKNGGDYVLIGTKPNPTATYDFYRADCTWRHLNAWLKKMGVSDVKAVHSMRKESGSLINQQFGIEAARHHLGHRDIRTTSSHYLTKKTRYQVTLPISGKNEQS